MNEEQQQEQAPRNPIITPNDPERWPLLEMASQECSVPLSPADEQAVLDMDEILNILDDQAAGLAAVQIGVPRRIFLLRNGWNSEEQRAFNNAYINPIVIAQSSETKDGPEGCLSLPGMGSRVRRPKSTTIQYITLSGEVKQETFTGFWSRAVCHEMDHLNGVLLTNHLEATMTKRVKRTKFGMKIDAASKKRVAARRAKNKRAKAARKLQRK